MAARSKPIQKFGPYLLFKELETDALGQTWRAGRIEGTELAGTVVLRRFTGGDHDALRASAEAAAPLVAQVSGSTIVKQQRYAVVDGVPVVEFEYVTGRSLRAIVDRARGGSGVNPNPIPADQVLAIIEKIAASMESMTNFKGESGRLLHGAVIPQSVWISDSGDVRVAGQLLGSGLVKSLANAKVAAEFARYIAPEIRTTAEPTKASEVFSAGALLYLMLTGQEPPDALNREEFDLALARPMTLVGKHPVPDDIRPILQKALAIDPAHRFPSIVEFHQEITRLLGSGAYAPTTFNLAFYLHSILKKEFEAETADRDREAKVNVARYIEEEATPAPPPTVPFQSQVEAAEEKPKSKLPLVAAIALLVLGGGGFAVWKFVLSSPASEPAKPAPATQQAAAAALPITQPIVTTTTPTTTAPTDTALTATDATTTAATATTATVNPEELKKKLIEEEIAKRFQTELLKLQADADKARQQQEAAKKPAAPAVTAAVTAAPAREELPAAQLDQARRAQAQPEPPPTATVATATQAPPPVQQPAPQQPAPVQEQPAVPQTKEGDLVSINLLDTMPRVIQTRTPVYPPLASRQKISAQIIVSALVSENGIVQDVKILRGDNRRLGFDEAAINAARRFTFTPGTKDGKRVKTWVPIPFDFKLQ